MGERTVSNFFRFLRLFGVDVFVLLEDTEETCTALVGWRKDFERSLPTRSELEDLQKVAWTHVASRLTEDALQLGAAAKDGGWLEGDRLTASLEVLSSCLGWDVSRTEAALEHLLSLSARMFDDDQPTDSFFIHL